MSTEETKILLQDAIKHADEELIDFLYLVALDYNANPSNYSDDFIKDLEFRRQRHINGESKSYTWDEVKDHLLSRIKT